MKYKALYKGNAQTGKFLILAITLIAFAGLSPSVADYINYNGHNSIAPNSIPITASGASGIGMDWIRFRNLGVAEPLGSGDITEITSVDVSISGSTDFNETKIAQVHLYFEENGNALYDNGAAVDDVLVASSALNPFVGDNADPATATLTIGTPSDTQFTNSWSYLYVVIDFSNTADESEDVSAIISSVTYRGIDGGDQTNTDTLSSTTAGANGEFIPAQATPTGSAFGDVDYFETTVAVTGKAPATAEQGDSDVEILELVFDIPNDTTATTYVDSIKVTRTGTPSADADLASIGLYSDDGATGGTFEGDETQLASGALTTGSLTLTPATDLTIIPGGVRYFIAATVAGTGVSTVDNNIGLEISDPSTDIVFTDPFEDDNAGVATDYVSVPLGFEYDQAGYITSATTEPSGGSNVFQILALVGGDTTPPTVIGYSPTTPPDAKVNDLITITFSEDMNLAATITDDNTVIQVEDSVGFISNTSTDIITYDSGTFTLTFDPPGYLDPNETYTVTVMSTVEDLATNTLDATGNPADPNYELTFTTETEPVVVSSSPADTQTFVQVNSAIEVNFSETMNLTSPLPDDDAVITVNYNGGATRVDAALASGITYSGQTLTFTPQDVLPADTLFTVTIQSTVTDLTFNALGTPDVFTFRTELAPFIPTTAPYNNTPYNSVSTDIAINFAEDMDPATIDDSVFVFQELVDKAGAVNKTIDTTSEGTLAYASRVLTFDPNPTVTYAGEVDPSVLRPAKWYRVTLAATIADLTGNELGSPYTFEFETEPAPVIAGTDPFQAAPYETVDTTISFTFSENMNLPDFDLAATVPDDESVITVYDDATPTPNQITAASITYSSGSQTLVFTPAANLTADTTYTATILASVADLTSNAIGTDYVLSFTTEPNPGISGTVPGNGSEAIDVDSDIEVIFAEDMNLPATITDDGTVIEVLEGATVITGSSVNTITYDSPSQTLSFSLPGAQIFSPATAYTVTIFSTVEDATGNPLGTDYDFSFTTDSTPTVASTVPEADETGVALATNITATFSKLMDETTIDTTSFTVAGSDGNNVAGTVTYDAANQTAVFTPDIAFDYETELTVSLTSAIKDERGTSLPAYTWTFNTLGSANLTEPQVWNNRIVPGSSNPMRVFIPKPDAGLETRITVQIFSASGRRVATLVSNRPYQEIVDDLPLVWDGTNGRRQNLGPGLYFIQIRGEGINETRRVLIVR